MALNMMGKTRPMNLFITLIIVYVAVVLLAATFQRRFIYYPNIQSPVVPLRMKGRVEEVVVQTEDGLEIGGWYLGPTDEKKPVIVFMHGNAGHYGDRAFKADFFHKKGFGIFLVGYRGYAGNEGFPSEQGFYADARAYLNMLFEGGFGSQDIVLYGESLGTGVAIQMASEFETRAVILETPYTSMTDAATHHFPWMPVRYFVRDRFDNAAKIAQISEPVLILHGTSDRVVPYKMGKKLYDMARQPKTMMTIKGGGHNNLYDWGVGEKIVTYLNELKGK